MFFRHSCSIFEELESTDRGKNKWKVQNIEKFGENHTLSFESLRTDQSEF